MWSNDFMLPTMQQAMNSLHGTGRVSLPGAPARWSSLTRVLLVVLLCLIGLLGLGGMIVPLIMAATGNWPGGAALAGVLGAMVMLGGVATLVFWIFRRQNAYRDIERQPVRLDPGGLTLRGIGPIPWSDFSAAEHRMVPAEHDSGWVRRAVMELTPRGLYAVNELVSPEMRRRISPPSGPLWNRHHRFIYVPGVEGLSQSEVMELINTAHRKYSAQGPQQPFFG